VGKAALWHSGQQSSGGACGAGGTTQRVVPRCALPVRGSREKLVDHGPHLPSGRCTPQHRALGNRGVWNSEPVGAGAGEMLCCSARRARGSGEYFW
jgi:hypothetical protein